MGLELKCLGLESWHFPLSWSAGYKMAWTDGLSDPSLMDTTALWAWFPPNSLSRASQNQGQRGLPSTTGFSSRTAETACSGTCLIVHAFSSHTFLLTDLLCLLHLYIWNSVLNHLRVTLSYRSHLGILYLGIIWKNVRTFLVNTLVWGRAIRFRFVGKNQGCIRQLLKIKSSPPKF